MRTGGNQSFRSTVHRLAALFCLVLELERSMPYASVFAASPLLLAVCCSPHLRPFQLEQRRCRGGAPFFCRRRGGAAVEGDFLRRIVFVEDGLVQTQTINGTSAVCLLEKTHHSSIHPCRGIKRPSLPQDSTHGSIDQTVCS